MRFKELIGMEINLNRSIIARAICLSLLAAHPIVVHADEASSLDELRNTVINLLDELVKKGVLTKEQAQAMVSNAQAKAAATAKAQADQEKAEQGAVRVPYVPQIVKDQIKSEVVEEVRPEVTKDVIEQAHAEKWGVPGALPEWITNLNINGDIRLRAEADLYANNNGVYLNYPAINAAGGYGKAGDNAILNTTTDQTRERVRFRLGFDEHITQGVSVGLQFGFDNENFAASTNQTLGSYGQNYNFAVYQAYLRYDAKSDNNLPWMTLEGGRFANPFYSTALLWYPDLNFDGTYGTWRFALDGSGSGATPPNIFFTAGAFPLQVVQPSYQNKWLLASQLGLDWPWAEGNRARIAFTYYYYDHITGVKNSVNSTLTNYTAPVLLQKGNTLFDISNNPTDPTVNLFALAALYHEADVTAGYEFPLAGHKVEVTADYVNNLGYNQTQIFDRTGLNVPKRGVGYLAELAFGSPVTGRSGTWRASVQYRYLQRDAVVDAFADQDFHLGGTDAKGYVLRGDWWFFDRTWLTLRYFSANAIDNPPLGIDMIFVDVNASF